MEEQMTFDFVKRPTIKGFPELRWTGKRPYESTQYYPAQLRERYGEETNGWINKIFWGDNLQVMSHLLKDYRGKIDLIYIDPPFDSKADYKKKIEVKGVGKAETDSSSFEEKQYGDIWTNDEYLQFMYERLIIMRELLSENGSIYISCRELISEQQDMTTIEFVCRDTGIGMTDEFQKHIFEPFAQEHTGSRTKFAGTGLGMPITKKLVEKMGGTITFESEEGVGTKFVVLIPFKIDMEADQRKEQENVSEKSIKGLHILLAEDNELNMEIAEFMLQNEGADVTKAWNGQEAVELFRKSKPGEFDVILMDIMMPVMNGYEATKLIRSLDREDARMIPIIAMTANAFTEDRLRAKEAGMDEHIPKPVDVKLLLKVIHKLTENRQKENA